MKALPHNKACEVEDFASDDLAGIMRDVDGRRYGAAVPRAGAGA